MGFESRPQPLSCEEYVSYGNQYLKRTVLKKNFRCEQTPLVFNEACQMLFSDSFPFPFSQDTDNVAG
uniref:Uncharacterized protein n=1 Tax=Anguilla anguilla TaxID=7936 RepID=A0A0E9QFP0_ANGAN